MGDEVQVIKQFTSHPERIFDGYNWIDYKFTETQDYLILESGHGSVKLSKQYCSFEFYNKGLIDSDPLFIDSIVPKMANDGTENWSVITQITNASCESYGDNTQLVAKKYVAGVGLLEYKYINNNQWKTQLEATNLSALTNKKFGFSQTIDLNRDSVIFGNQTVNLDNYNDTSLDRTWLINHQAEVLNLLNEFNFDLDQGFDHLESVYILDTGNNKSKLVFNYLYDQNIILPNEKLIIDPTFTSSTPSSEGRVYSTSATGASCPTTLSTGDTTLVVRRSPSASSDNCQGVYFNFSTLGVGMNITSVFGASLTYDVSSVTDGINCDIKHLGFTGGTNEATYDALTQDVGDIVDVVQNSSLCSTVSNNKVETFTSTAYTRIVNDVNTDNIVTIGIFFTDTARDIFTPRSDIGSNDAILSFNYTQAVFPPTNFSCVGLPHGYSCSWDPVNATGVTGYYLQTSVNNSTWPLGNQTLIGNTTSGLINGSQYGNYELNYIRVNSTAPLINSTSSNVVLVRTDNIPDAPSITSNTVSTSQIDVIRTAGSSDGGDTVDDYNLQASINGAGFVDLVTNSTIVNFYNHTGLTEADTVVYRWRDGNDVGWSGYSSNSTSQTLSETVATVIMNPLNVGDVLNGTAIVTITNANPSPVTVSSVKILQNGTIVLTEALNQQIATGNSHTFSGYYYLISDDNPHSYQMRFTISNNTNTIDFTSAAVDLTREYDPDYFLAVDTTQGYVNYTFSRSSDQNELTLKTNRDYSGGEFNIECLYRTTTEAALNSGGVWHNYTSVGYMNDTLIPAIGNNYYIDCYNDGLLFTVVSYTNSSLLLSGIEVFDNTYGAFIGVPVGVFFIVLVAGMANQRTAPMWIIVILAIAGIMSAIGFFTLETNVWALALIAALLGIIVGRKLF